MTTAQTISLAAASCAFRAVCGVIDRHSFGLKRHPIVGANLVNNAMPGILLMFYFMVTGSFPELCANLFNGRLVLFSLAVQLVAFAFSYGFTKNPVTKVNLASRVGDFLLPFALLAIGVNVRPVDIAFALGVTGCVCLALRPTKADFGHLVGLSLLIGGAQVVQGVMGEIVFGGQSAASSATLATAAALLLWRGIFCIPLLFVQREANASYLSNLFIAFNRDGLASFATRTAAVLISQVAFVGVLAHGNRLLAWPILNSVSVFAAIISAFLLKEAPSKEECVAIGLMIVASILRVFL